MHSIHDGLKALEERSESLFGSAVLQLWGKYNPFVETVNGQEVYHPEMLKDIYDLVELHKPSLIAALLLGSEYFAFCFPGTEREFDLVVPGLDQAPPADGIEIIPYDIVYEMAYNTQRPFLGLLRDVQTHTKIPVICLLPPPPAADIAVISRYLPESMRAHVSKYFMPSTMLLYKSWCISAAATRNICAEFGVETLPLPDEALNEAGLLRSEFVRDSLHGNTDYTTLVIKQLAQLLETLPQASEV